MISNILCSTLGDKLIQSCIVVLIGVSMVFLLLFALIGVVKLLQYVEKGLIKWDKIMSVKRANKAEIKAVKLSFIEAREAEENAVIMAGEKGELTKAEVNAKVKAIKDDFKANKLPLMKKQIAELKAKHKGLTADVNENTTTTIEEVVDDEELIAVISAAIAVATERECAERKVKFKVRSIKHIK